MKLEIGKVYKYIGLKSHKVINRYIALGLGSAKNSKDIYNYFPKNENNEISFDNSEQVYFKSLYVEIKQNSIFKVENFSAESIKILLLNEPPYYSPLFSLSARLVTDYFPQEFIDNCIEIE